VILPAAAKAAPPQYDDENLEGGFDDQIVVFGGVWEGYSAIDGCAVE
jgi:hypothetical protein